jgi:GNAT superfamily N-acetyltransferase
MPPQLIVVTDPTANEYRAPIVTLLRDFNVQAAGRLNEAPLAIVLREGEGKVIGGLYAFQAYDWLNVELVYVPDALRGQGLGAALIARAEEVAGARGCRGVWLDTFSFQARGFYERLGYAVFGTVEDHPVGGARYFMKKALR